MIRTYLEFQLKPGRADDLCRYFRDERVLERSVTVEGCHSAELTISADGAVAIVTAEWDSAEAYDRWISRPDRTQNSEGLQALVADDVQSGVVAQMMTVAHRATAD